MHRTAPAAPLFLVGMGLLLSGCGLIGVDLGPGPAGPRHRPSQSPLVAGSLDLGDVRVVEGSVRPVPPAEIDALEQQLGIQVPAGYRDYMARLGGGYLCDSLMVLTPENVLARVPDHRGMMAAWWFWKAGDVPFGQDEAMASVPIADDLAYDTIVLSPGDPDHLFVLPRDGDRVLVSDGDLLDLAGAMCRGELGGQPARTVEFTPAEGVGSLFGNPHPPIAPGLPAPDLTRPPREVVDAYLAELVGVEAWAIEQAGGPDAVVRGEIPEELSSTLNGEFERRLAGIHQRYASPTLAPALRGLIPWAAPPLHSRFHVAKEEAVGPDRVRFLIVDADGQRIWWTLGRGVDGWRLVMLTPTWVLPG